MLTHAEVLAALSEWLSPGQVTQVLNRLLRVPEAWEWLHLPESIAHLQEHQPDSKLTPVLLGHLALDILERDGSVMDPLPARVRNRMDEIWQTAKTVQPPSLDLEGVQLLGLQLAQELDDSSNSKGIVNRVLEVPHLWRSALACARLHSPAPAQLIDALLSSGRPEGITLAANCLLANMDAADASEHWPSGQLQVDEMVVSILFLQGETELATALAGRNPSSDIRSLESLRQAPTYLLDQSTKQLVGQKPVVAMSTLEQAWNHGTHLTARVADQMAEVARLQEDWVLENEARQRALQVEATPTRRANLALARTRLGHPEQALEILPSKPEGAQELVAKGMAKLEQGQIEQSLAFLRLAAQDASRLGLSDVRWLPLLSEALKKAGDSRMAVEVGLEWCKADAANAQAHVALARLYLWAGDTESAVQEAYLSSALAPQSTKTLRSLATSLMAAGRAEDALEHWETLAETEQQARLDLAMCALEAGQLEAATEAAGKVLEETPHSAQAKILLAKVLGAEGKIEAALEALEELTRANPHDPQAWLALSELTGTFKGSDQEGTILDAAAQSAPRGGQLHFARAKWLRGKGRLSEALQAAERATFLDPDQAEWLAEYGEILTELGHHDMALPILQKAVNQQPWSQRSSVSLALALEARGKTSEAWKLLGRRPLEDDPEANLVSGRIAVKAAAQGDRTSLKRALEHLQRAASLEGLRSEVEFWMAKAQLASGNPEQAVNHFMACLENSSEIELDRHYEAVFGLAEAAELSGDAAAALPALQSLQAHFPEDISLIVRLSQSYLKSDQPEEGMRAAELAVETSPNNEQALRQHSLAAVATETWDVAIDSVEQILKQRPEDPKLWLELAWVGSKSGRVAFARRAIARGLTLGSSNPEVLAMAAELLEGLERRKSAQRLLERASRYDPTSPEILQQLSDVCIQNGDLGAAQKSWDRWSSLSPDDPNPLIFAARALWEAGRPSASIEKWQRALEISPTSPEIHIALAHAYENSGDPGLAMSVYHNALRLLPDDVGLMLESGLAQLRHGDFETANTTLRQAAHLSPDLPGLSTGLAESLLAANKPKQALQVLEASPGPPTDAGNLAIVARAHLEAGDLPSAEKALQETVSLPIQLAQDALRLSETQRRAGRWNQACETLDEWLQTSNNLNVSLALAKLRFRLFDARWLFETIGQAASHAPPGQLVQATGLHSYEELMQRVAAQGISVEAPWEQLRIRERLLKGTATDQDRTSLESQAADSGDVETLEALLIAALRADKLEEATRLLDDHRPLLSRGEWTLLLEGICHAARGSMLEARAAFSQTAENPVLAPLAQFLEAQTWLAEDQADEAIPLLNAALASWPDESLWHYLLADIYLERDAFDAALPHLQQASELQPLNIEYNLALARTLRGLGSYQAAGKAYSKVLEAHASDGTIWKEAGQAALAAGDAERAAAQFRQAIELCPSDPQCMIGSARADVAMGHLTQARDLAQAAVRLSPDDPEVLIGLGEILETEGKFEKAIEAYDKALSISDDPASIHRVRTRSLIRSGRARQAQDELEEFLQESPEEDQLWSILATVHEANGDLEKAVEAASHAVRLAPRRTSYRIALGRLARTAGQLDRALDELLQAETQSTGDIDLLIELGRVYESRRENVRALETYRRAIQRDPDSAQAHFRAGVALKQLKEYQQAGDMFKRTVALDPKDTDALHQLAAVRAIQLVHFGVTEAVG